MSDDAPPNAAPTPFSQLEAPAASQKGLTGEERRRIFLKDASLADNVDVRKNVETFGCDLSLIEFPEWQRTKHVHRLHPYLGKFVPQLVELFLRRFFKPGDTILDPFAGSGTTLVEANALGMHAFGIELSPFNCMIIAAKTRRHDLSLLRREYPYSSPALPARQALKSAGLLLQSTSKNPDSASVLLLIGSRSCPTSAGSLHDSCAGNEPRVVNPPAEELPRRATPTRLALDDRTW